MFKILKGNKIKYTYYLKDCFEAVVYKDKNKLGKKESAKVLSELIHSIGSSLSIVMASRRHGNFNKREYHRALRACLKNPTGRVLSKAYTDRYNGVRPSWIAYDEVAHFEDIK